MYIYRKINYAFIITTFLSACSYEQPTNNQVTQPISNTRYEPVTNGLADNELKVTTNYSERWEGHLDGVGYKYSRSTNSEWKGSINPNNDNFNGRESWKLNCEVDKISDDKICLVRNELLGLFIQYKNNSTPLICSLKHDFPGERARLRIDGGRVYTSTTDEGCFTHNINTYKNLRAGSNVVIRSIVWPYEGYEENEGKLVGVELLDKLVKHLKNKLSQQS